MKKTFLLLLFFLSVFYVSDAQHFIPEGKKEIIYLWPDIVPNESSTKSRPVQTPDTSRNVVRITNITNPSLTVYKPEESNNNNSAIIIAPGGGYSYLAINIEGYEIAEWLNNLGFTAFVLEYRTPDNRLGAFNDMQRAIRMVRSKANQYNFSPDRICVMGFSAGGHLALRASSNYMEDSYPKSDKIDSLSSKPDFAVLMYPGYRTTDTDISLHENMPPLFLFGTFDDFLIEEFFDLGKALKKVNASVEMHLYKTGGHGYGIRKEYPAANEWPLLFEKWYKKSL